MKSNTNRLTFGIICFKITSKCNFCQLMATKYTFLILLFLFSGFVAFAQEEDTEEAVPSYQTMYDDPYDIRNLYLQFQPLYGDIGVLNVTGGFGVEGAYYHKSNFDLQLAFRTSYGKRFDINRDAATRNATNTAEFPLYYNLEFGGTYHIRDIMQESSSKVLLYSKQLKGTEWASTVARQTEINGKVRTVIGARLGGMLNSTTANINATLAAQGKELFYENGIPVIGEDIYSNLQTFTIYAGASYSWIRNYAVEFSERWDPSGDDQILTPYFDIMFAPSINLSDVVINGESVSTLDIDETSIGFRGGLNVKFNRKLSWGYGVESGVRPGLKKRGFFLVFKMSFPVYAKKLGAKEKPATE
jgi:hypothetical protein